MTYIYGDDYGLVEVIQHSGSDQTIIDAARVSFAADRAGRDLGESRWRPEADPKLLRYLIRNEHWSPFEHCHITWHVVVPLFVRSQWHRHRTWAYNEVSRRYTEEDIRFYVPNALRKQAISNKQGSTDELTDPLITSPVDGRQTFAHYAIKDWVRRSCDLYEALLKEGVAREQARMILPQNLYTRFYATVNFRNAIAFLKLRRHEHAQWEIRVAADAMHEQLKGLYPEAMKAVMEVG